VLPFGRYHGLSVEEVGIRDPVYLGIIMYSEWFRVFEIYSKMVDEGYLRFSPIVKLNKKTMPISVIQAEFPESYEHIYKERSIRSKFPELDLWLKEHNDDIITSAIKLEPPYLDIGDIVYID
jgi:hypothetical protein